MQDSPVAGDQLYVADERLLLLFKVLLLPAVIVTLFHADAAGGVFTATATEELLIPQELLSLTVKIVKAVGFTTMLEALCPPGDHE